jgi:alkanesulfonate monooxygenase SsuD/methylene tetrahydromethanopterin reductase-like flavin-dependent oxidoreductase (luciferase family)
MGGGSIRVLEMTASYCQGWMPFAPSITGLTRRLRVLEELVELKGRQLSELEIIPSMLFQLGKSIPDAKKQLPKWGKPPDESRAILGTPEECLARINEYAEAGATHLTLRLVHPSIFQRDIKTIAEEIIPRLKPYFC